MTTKLIECTVDHRKSILTAANFNHLNNLNRSHTSFSSLNSGLKNENKANNYY